jgi:hypothetical protein
MVFSTEREDPDFKTSIGTPPWAARLKSWENSRRKTTSTADAWAQTPANGSSTDEMFVWRNEEPIPPKGQQGSAYAARNPIAVWKIGDKPCKGMEFSPDGQALALVSEDGTLKMVDPTGAK